MAANTLPSQLSHSITSRMTAELRTSILQHQRATTNTGPKGGGMGGTGDSQCGFKRWSLRDLVPASNSVPRHQSIITSVVSDFSSQVTQPFSLSSSRQCSRRAYVALMTRAWPLSPKTSLSDTVTAARWTLPGLRAFDLTVTSIGPILVDSSRCSEMSRGCLASLPPPSAPCS